MIQEQTMVILKRLLVSFLMIVILVVSIFFMMHLLPGDPFQQYYSPELDNRIAEQVKTKFGLDKPVSIQFIYWLKNIFSGDFGFSLVYKKPVSELISSSITVTLSISLTAFILQIILTIPLGLFLLKHNGKKN